MKRIGTLSIALCIAAAGLTGAAFAASEHVPSGHYTFHTLGLGVEFGDITAITAKLWTTPTTAFDASVTYSSNSYFGILISHLWHFPDFLSSVTKGKLDHQWVSYIGAGGVFFHYSSGVAGIGGGTHDSIFGARFPVGVEFLPHTIPIGVFAELAPGITLNPSIDSFFQGEIGARYYF